MNDFEIEVSPIVEERLTTEEIEMAAAHAIVGAERLDDWEIGKCYHLKFSKHGKGYCVAISYRDDGYHLSVALPQEITFVT